MRQIILDTETTGLRIEEGHRMIEIGCVELINRKLTGKYYHQYINPEREVDAEALEVHGLTNSFLANQPIFANIVHDFIEFISGAELIIHNAPFDIGFINYELLLLKYTHQSITELCHVIDTLALARQIHVGQRNSLDALCKRYKIDNSHRELHGALLDAHLLAHVYLAMTGGQGSLFDELETMDAVSETKNKVGIDQSRQRKLVVLRATAEEVMAHEAYMKRILEN